MSDNDSKPDDAGTEGTDAETKSPAKRTKADAKETKPADQAAKQSEEKREDFSRRLENVRAEMHRAQLRSNIVVLVTAIVFLAIGLFIGWMLPGQLFGGGGGATPTAAPTGDTAPTGPAEQIVPPDGDAQRAWITVPSNNANPNALIVDIHTDYQCPYCKATETTYGPLFQALSDQGLIVWRQHTRIFLDRGIGNDSSTRASIAAACVDVADGSKYADYHELIFANQPQEGAGFTDAQLRDQWPAAVGLSGKQLETFQGCYDTQATRQFVEDVEQNNIQAIPNQSPPNGFLFGGNTPVIDGEGRCTGTPGSEIGVCGTPTLFVQGVQFGLNEMFNSDWTPKATTPEELLLLLQQIAAAP